MSNKTYDLSIRRKQRNIRVTESKVTARRTRCDVTLHGHHIGSAFFDETILQDHASGMPESTYRIWLSSCGYYTRSTKDALNRLLAQTGCPIYVKQIQGEWYLMHALYLCPFTDGTLIVREGLPIPSTHIESMHGDFGRWKVCIPAPINS